MGQAHAYHEALPDYWAGNIFHKGCGACETRARQGLAGLMELDPHRLHRLWDEMLMIRYRGGSYRNATLPPDVDKRSPLDRRTWDLLYQVGVFLERWTDLDPWQPLARIGGVGDAA